MRTLCNPGTTEIVEVTSPAITKLSRRLEELSKTLDVLKEEHQKAEKELEALDVEYGGEIARIKKEFSRMKERSYEETKTASDEAKINALKEVLPITDNYYRAKPLFQPLQSENEHQIQDAYDKAFAAFLNVIQGFGASRVVSVGQPFDFNFMEAIMASPSTQYSADIVSAEYQVGYKMGEKCIRPAMVVVSTGPGPQS
jgi:molecular chaperone GrpE